jgi:hypothetical protein
MLGRGLDEDLRIYRRRRHFRAMTDAGGKRAVACDPDDLVGVMDGGFPTANACGLTLNPVTPGCPGLEQLQILMGSVRGRCVHLR